MKLYFITVQKFQKFDPILYGTLFKFRQGAVHSEHTNCAPGVRLVCAKCSNHFGSAANV